MFALAHPASCCLLQQLTFRTRPLPRLLTAEHLYTSKQHFDATSYTHGHTYLHHIDIIHSSSSLHFYSFWQAGCLRPLPSGTPPPWSTFNFYPYLYCRISPSTKIKYPRLKPGYPRFQPGYPRLRPKYPMPQPEYPMPQPKYLRPSRISKASAGTS